MTDVNLVAVLVAGIVPLILGSVWYNPKFLGTLWMKLARLTPEMMEDGKKKMPLHMFLGFITALITAYVLAHFSIVWGVFDYIDALELAFWVWLGFQMPVNLGAVLWEGKSWKLFFINTGYQLIMLALVMLVLVLFS